LLALIFLFFFWIYSLSGLYVGNRESWWDERRGKREVLFFYYDIDIFLWVSLGGMMNF
jgi:hypothetical protein